MPDGTQPTLSDKDRLDGPIWVGQRMVWETGNKHCARVEVVEIRVNPNDEVWLLLRDMDGRAFWNELDRVREACIRV